MSRAKSPRLFDDCDEWQRHWHGMPEFIQDDMSPHRTVRVHFRNDEDVADFERLVGQRVTRYNLIWYPAAEPRRVADKRYADES